MTYEQYKALNPDVSDEDLVADLKYMCDLASDGRVDFCEALDEYYAPGISKLNQLREVFVSGKKKTEINSSEQKKQVIIWVVAIVFLSLLLLVLYKIYR